MLEHSSRQSSSAPLTATKPNHKGAAPWLCQLNRSSLSQTPATWRSRGSSPHPSRLLLSFRQLVCTIGRISSCKQELLSHRHMLSGLPFRKRMSQLTIVSQPRQRWCKQLETYSHTFCCTKMLPVSQPGQQTPSTACDICNRMSIHAFSCILTCMQSV